MSEPLREMFNIKSLQENLANERDESMTAL